MNKKDFSDWLVVSDIDGTLNNKLRKTPEKNIRAIDRFVHRLSGNFTLASARNVQSLYPHYKRLPDITTPAIVLNGAGIYDYSQKKMLWFNPVDDSGVSVVEKALERFSFLEVGIFTDDDIYLIRPRILSPFMMHLDKLSHHRVKSISQVPKGNWGKVIFFCYPNKKNEVRSFVSSLTGNDISFIDTTSMSFDMVNSTTNKGNAIMKLAQILGVPRENTAGIGDYYNDIDMLKAVAHSACCKQAPEELHKMSEYVTCHCNDGAVADFLEYIENKYAY